MLDETYLRKKIKRLSETVWEKRASGADIEEWLSSFSQSNAAGINEQLHMLHLLSNFLYFGIREVRELLKALFQQMCQRPLIIDIRRANNDTADLDLIDRALVTAVGRSRFLAVGNPSESGQHLLYYFRQENRLPSDLFPNQYELPGFPGATAAHGSNSVDRYIFIDDMCGSGQQIEVYSANVIAPLRAAYPAARVCYYPLFATSEGLQYTRQHCHFTEVQCLMELDESFKCFSGTSRFYDSASERTEATDICSRYGSLLFPRHPLGYRNCQLAVGFNHNTPDNTLPVFWAESDTISTWSPIFRRYVKV